MAAFSMHKLQSSLLASGFAAAICLSLISGCGESVNAEIRQLRQQLLTETAPTGELSISDIRARLKSEELAAGSEVTVRVRINAGELPPWETGKAAFIVTDAMGHDGDENNDPHECPFCSRDIQDNLAQVRFLDPNGTIINTDARELFDVTEFQLVVIKGKASLDDSDMLLLDAGLMFVPR